MEQLQQASPGRTENKDILGYQEGKVSLVEAGKEGWKGPGCAVHLRRKTDSALEGQTEEWKQRPRSVGPRIQDNEQEV